MKSNQLNFLYCIKGNLFNHFIKEDLKIPTWKIIDDKIENRLNTIIDYQYAQKLIEQGKKLKYLNTKYTEIISWIDSMYLIYKLINRINHSEREKIHIIQEFQIPNSNNRIDFILSVENRILLIEFSSQYENNANQSNIKKEQLEKYKNLLSNCLSKDYYIKTFRFIYTQDLDKNHTLNESNINDLQLEKLLNEIENFLLLKNTFNKFRYEKNINLPFFLNFLNDNLLSKNDESICKNDSNNYLLEYLKATEQYNTLLNEYENLKKQNDKLQSENNILRIRMKEIRDITNKA